MTILPNAKHERFAQLLAKGETATRAYSKAGYKPCDSHASRLAGNGKVRQRVTDILAAGAARTEITVEKVLSELAKIGFADMRKLLKWTGNIPQMDMNSAELSGEVEITAANFVQLFDSDSLDDDIAAAISEISQTKDGTLKVKLHDKKAALVAIGNHLGMFTTKVEHSGHLEIEQVASDADDFTRRISARAAARAIASGTGDTQH